MKPRSTPSCARPLQHHGTSLIEVLVALVVLSVGLLGLAGLQLNALKLNQTAMQRSEATLFAYSILDQMRADAAVAKAGGYDIAFADLPADGSPLAVWRTAMEGSLGISANGQVCRVAALTLPEVDNCTNDPLDEFFRVTVSWDEATIATNSGTTLAGGEQTLTVVGRL